MRKWILATVLAVVLVPVIEIVLLVQLGRLLGWWPVLAWVVAALAVGGYLVRRHRPGARRHTRQANAANLPAVSEAELIDPGPDATMGAFGFGFGPGLGGPSAATVRTTAGQVLLAVAGILFIIPGVLTDVAALVLLIPAVRRALTDVVAPRLAQRAQKKMLAAFGFDDEFTDLLRSAQMPPTGPMGAPDPMGPMGAPGPMGPTGARPNGAGPSGAGPSSRGPVIDID